jgi:hypothetical protein
MGCNTARRTPDYLRHGTINLFAALDAKAGTVIGEFHRRHRALEFRSFLETIDAAVPGQLELHLILQLRHPQDPGQQALAVASSTLPFALHAHRRLVAQPGRALVRAAHRNNCVAAFTAAPQNSKMPSALTSNTTTVIKPFIWTKTADQILDSVARFYKRISNSGQ